VARLGPEPLEIAALDFAAIFPPPNPRQGAAAGPDFRPRRGEHLRDEALFRAGITPWRLRRLRQDRVMRLHQALGEVLTEAIAAGGSSISDYVDAEGRQGFSRSATACISAPASPA